MMSTIVTQGLSVLDIDTYESLGETLDNWNECHLGGRVLSEARMCGLHEQAVRLALGELAYAASMEAKIEAAGNDLEKMKKAIWRFPRFKNYFDS